MTSLVRAGKYRIVERTVDRGADFDLPEGAQILSATLTFQDRVHLVLLEPTLVPLTEGGRHRASSARQAGSESPL